MIQAGARKVNSEVFLSAVPGVVVAEHSEPVVAHFLLQGFQLLTTELSADRPVFALGRGCHQGSLQGRVARYLHELSSKTLDAG